MVDIEELKKQFFVDDHDRIVIPFHRFQAEWDEELLDKGYECHAKGDKMIVTAFNPGPERRRPPPRTEGDAWTPEETDRLIQLWKAKDKTVNEIAKEFPNRNNSAVQNKLGRLKKAGKIEPRWKVGEAKPRPPTKKEKRALELLKRGELKKFCITREREVEILSEFDKQLEEFYSAFMRISAFGRAGSDKEFAELAQTILQFKPKWDMWWSRKKEKMLVEALSTLRTRAETEPI